jgi:hypothetical protein
MLLSNHKVALCLLAAVAVVPAWSHETLDRPSPKSQPAGATEPDFTREVRPLLARYCFKCHGPDEKTRKAGLRLDQPVKKDGVVVPGKPEQSELIARVFSTDADTVMPPPSTKTARRRGQSGATLGLCAAAPAAAARRQEDGLAA